MTSWWDTGFLHDVMRVGLQSVIDPNLWMCFYIEGSSDMEIPFSNLVL